MSKQLTFDLPSVPALGRADFMESPSNAAALRMIEDWQNWPDGRLILTGPEGSGKTHLAHVWAQAAEARIIAASDLREDLVAGLPTRLAIEDADTLAGQPQAQAALFHLHNRLAAEDGRLLITARSARALWSLELPDLVSRLQATTIVELHDPDDQLLTAILIKLFADRQLAPPANVMTYLVRRMDRSFAAARSIVEQMDAKSLANKRELTIALAAEVLDNQPD